MLSHWHATLDQPSLPLVALPSSAQVVVVGGGVHGAAAAYWLARAGASPLLIERAGPAAGASGHNGGLCVTGSAEVYPDAIARLGHEQARAVWALSVEGFDTLHQIVAEEGIECDLRRCGQVALALNEDQLAGYRRSRDALAADGFAMELLDRETIKALTPTPLGPEVVGGKLNQSAAALHSARLVYGLLAAAVRHGARLCMGVEVTGLQPAGSGVRIITGQGAIDAGAAVVNLNAWSRDVLPFLAGLITPVRGQALATLPVARAIPYGFGVGVTPTGEYGQQTSAGSVIFGGCRAVAPDRDVEPREMVATPVVQEALDAALPRLFPSLAGVPIAQRWAGLMAFTPDYLPIADAAPDLPGVWFAGGFCGHGMPFAPVFGRLLAQAATTGAKPAALDPFSLSRPTLQKL
jgi:gamma-glutamylputrescine oxidase